MLELPVGKSKIWFKMLKGIIIQLLGVNFVYIIQLLFIPLTRFIIRAQIIKSLDLEN